MNKPTTLRRQTSSTAPRAPAVIDEIDDAGDEGAPLAALDPLAAEPLSSEEIKLVETHKRAVSEQREGALEALRKASEAKLPIDPDAADSLAEANDERLEIRLRPRKRR